jgi:endo-1,4-beta-D-glucanase Y
MYTCIRVYTYTRVYTNTDGREALKKDRAEKLAAQEREKSANDERARKLQEELEAKALQDSSMAEAAKLQVRPCSICVAFAFLAFAFRASEVGPKV